MTFADGAGGRSKTRPSRRIAVIDIGTVTTRLLIAEVSRAPYSDEPRVTVLLKRSTITQLGEGLTKTGRLDDAAIERVAETVAGYLSEVAKADAVLATCVATSAARDAANGDIFASRLADLGVTVQVIAGSREATLTFSGITSAFPGHDLLTCDVGGGSTELVFGDSSGPTIRRFCSLDIGARRMTELYLVSDPPSSDELARLHVDCLRSLDEGFFGTLDSAPSRLLAVAGTATSAVAIAKGLEVYDSSQVHGATLDLATLHDILQRLSALPLSERERIIGLESKRAGVIVAGLSILSCILEISGLGEMTVSESDILMGLVLDACE